MQPDPRLSTAPARTDGGASSLSAAALVLVGATLLVLLGGVLSLLVRSAGSSLPGREVLRLAGSLLLLLGLGLSAPALGWLVFAPVRAGRAAAGIGRHRVMLPV